MCAVKLLLGDLWCGIRSHNFIRIEWQWLQLLCNYSKSELHNSWLSVRICKFFHLFFFFFTIFLVTRNCVSIIGLYWHFAFHLYWWRLVIGNHTDFIKILRPNSLDPTYIKLQVLAIISDPNFMALIVNWYFLNFF